MIFFNYDSPFQNIRGLSPSDIRKNVRLNSIFQILFNSDRFEIVLKFAWRLLWQSRCVQDSRSKTMGSGSMMRRRRGGEKTISIEKGGGAHPVEGDRVAFALVARWKRAPPGPTGPYRAPETAKNHRVARKIAARQYLISPLIPPPPPLFLFFFSPLPLVLIFLLLLDTIYELSRQPFLVLFIFYHYHIRFFSIPPSSPRALSLSLYSLPY